MQIMNEPEIRYGYNKRFFSVVSFLIHYPDDLDLTLIKTYLRKELHSFFTKNLHYTKPQLTRC